MLKEEGVVKAYSQQDYQRTLVIILEDFGGKSLKRWMQQRPEFFCPMLVPTFLRLAINLTDILGRIHATNVIHNEVFLELVTAVQRGLIVPISDLDEQLLVQDYKFLHDRVQQAAYALIDESHKQVVHLQIGRNILENPAPERLFETVDHLNQGIELVTDQSERHKIAQLNLIAGQKAKVAIATCD
ncbi:MAG: hypothetical protein V7K40_32775 [Nostoc sp.]|uniref:hypothetical protein n=1 Tax=Nostoc sp. TaxID=1180 RepID=UPI002FF4DF5A